MTIELRTERPSPDRLVLRTPSTGCGGSWRITWNN